MNTEEKKIKKLYFRFKQHPGDFFRDTSIEKLPDPNDEQEQFWIWFHPRFATSQDVCDLGNLYKLLHNEEFDEDFMKDNEWYDYYSSLSKREIQNAIDKYETEITADCFENFYHLIRKGEVEIIEK